jgi:hypothetical protein
VLMNYTTMYVMCVCGWYRYKKYSVLIFTVCSSWYLIFLLTTTCTYFLQLLSVYTKCIGSQEMWRNMWTPVILHSNREKDGSIQCEYDRTLSAIRPSYYMHWNYGLYKLVTLNTDKGSFKHRFLSAVKPVNSKKVLLCQTYKYTKQIMALKYCKHINSAMKFIVAMSLSSYLYVI